MKFIGECTKFIDVDDQNRMEEPPEYGTTPRMPEPEEDEEYEAPEDDYGMPEPPVSRKGSLKVADDEIPFE